MRRSEQVSRIAKLVGLLAAPVLLWLLFAWRTFSGFVVPESLDYAQLARHLADGHGFVTSVILPLSLAFAPHYEAHPSLFHPPVFPFWEALWFCLGNAGSKMAALASGSAWVFAAWFTYALAARAFDRKVAGLALALFAVNLSALRFSVAGVPNAMAAALFTALLWSLAAACPRGQEEQAVSLPGGRVILSAVLLGLACLTDYSLASVALVPVLLFWLLWPAWARLEEAGGHEGWPMRPPLRWWREYLSRVATWFWTSLRLRAVLSFGCVMCLTVSLWLVRNYRVAGDPFFCLTRYDLLVRTDAHPGQSVYRRFTPPPPRDLPIRLPASSSGRA
jgi:hypothetical protein